MSEHQTGLEQVIGALRSRFGERLSRSQAHRDHHGRGEGGHEAALPDAVFFAHSKAEVAQAVALCHEHRVPVIPYGVGTSLEGQVLAPHGGLSLDLSGMNQILSINPGDMDCRVEAGVTREQLNAYLRDLGLFFSVDPGANATLGGMAATRASGTNAVRYGTMREVTMGLSVVTSSGEVVETGTRARKSSMGYDLTRLFVGSEGTLGVICELQLRLFGIPETIAAAVCQFPTLEAAVNSVMEVLSLGVPIARIELLDEVQMRASIAYSKLEGFEPAPTLFLEFHGGPAAVAEQVEVVRSILDDNGGSAFRWATATEERTALWKARHDAYWAVHALWPGKRSFATDACVPISALAAAITQSARAIEDLGLPYAVTGHVGDGNFHMLVLFDPADPQERRRADAAAMAVAQVALSHGGTASGEHGVGLHKLPLMAAEHGPAIDLMRSVKQALDPLNIMNPGKLIPPPQPGR